MFNKRDVTTVAKHVELPLKLKNLQFVDPACSRFAGNLVKVEHGDLEPFVNCMASLGIQPIDRKTALFITHTYGPGAPLHFVRDHDKIVSLYSIPPKPGNAGFMIEPVLFTSHVSGFRREIAPAAKLKKTIDASTSEHTYAAS